MTSSSSVAAARHHVPGDALWHVAPVAAALLIALNDFWLKREHPGWLSGKLSDVGLCFFFPIFLSALAEWAAAVVAWSRARLPPPPSANLYRGALLVACSYFIALKTWPPMAELHVAWLRAVFHGHAFAAVTDPTDLGCLPASYLAYRYLERHAHT